MNQLHHAANRLHSYAAKRLKRPYSEFPVGEIDVVAQFISLGSFEEVLHSVEKYTGCKVHPLTALFSDSSCHKDQFTVVGLKFGTQNFIYPRLLKIRRTLTGLSSWFFPEVAGGAGGGGVLLGILRGGMPPGSSNPDPISDQKM